MPLVSVIISTYNNKQTVGQCLESISRQTYLKLEIIVVDEWSTDGTREITKKYGAKVFLHGRERAENRNFGISQAKGKCYLIVDSDMELEPGVVEECIGSCIKNKFDAIVIPEKSVGRGFWAQVRAFERSFYKGDDIVEAARFFKRELIKKIGGYDTEMVGVEDWDLHQRILRNSFKVGRINSYIIHHEGKLSLARLLKKKVYYGKAFIKFKKRYPKTFKKSIIRISLLKNWHHFLLKPKYGLGVLVLKFLEGMALFYGMWLAQRGQQYKHY